MNTFFEIHGNKSVRRWLALWLLLLLFPSLATAATPITLAEAIALALRNNISIKNAYLSRISGKFSLVAAEYHYEPQFAINSATSQASAYSDTTGHYTDTTSLSGDVGVTLNLPTGGQLALTKSISGTITNTTDAYTSEIALTLTQPLLRGGGITAGTASLVNARHAEQNSYLALKNSVIGFVTQVIKQYRSYLLAQRSEQITRLSLQRSQRQVDITKALIKAGRQPEVDLVQTETALANQELSYHQAQNQVESERLALLNLLRIDESIELELVEPIEIAAFDMSRDKVLETAYENRPDYLQNLIGLKTAELNKLVAENNRLWQLDLTASTTMAGTGTSLDKANTNREIHQDNPDYSVGLALAIPINDVPRDKTLLDARIGLMTARNNKVVKHEAIRLELINALRNLKVNLKQVSMAKRSLDLSRKQLELEQKKLKAGRSTNFQVVAYQNELTSAENTYISTQISYLNALTDLDQSMGTTLEHWGVEVTPEEYLHPENVSDFEAGEKQLLLDEEQLNSDLTLPTL